jgi:hypothetical protein
MTIAGMLLWTMLAAAVFSSCRGKDDPNDDPYPPNLTPPLGLAFSAPFGDVIFFSLTDRRIIHRAVMNGWTLAAEVNRTGDRLFVAENANNQIHTYSLPAFALQSYETFGATPLDIYPNHSSTLAYLISQNGNFWSYSLHSHVYDTLGVGMSPRRMALLPPSDAQAWVVCSGDSSVHIVDLISFHKLDTIRFQRRPTDICFASDGSKAYVALMNPGSVVVLNVQTRTAMDSLETSQGHLETSQGPFELGVSDDGLFLAVSDSALGTVRIWNLTDHLSYDLAVGKGAGRIRFSRHANDFYVLSSGTNRVLRVAINNGIPMLTDSIYVPSILREITLWEDGG